VPFLLYRQRRRRVTFTEMIAAGTPAQVAAKLKEFGRHMDHVIGYPASFGMTEERSRQVTADLLKGAAPG
jgi:hypothetical protein